MADIWYLALRTYIFNLLLSHISIYIYISIHNLIIYSIHTCSSHISRITAIVECSIYYHSWQYGCYQHSNYVYKMTSLAAIAYIYIYIYISCYIYIYIYIGITYIYTYTLYIYLYIWGSIRVRYDMEYIYAIHISIHIWLYIYLYICYLYAMIGYVICCCYRYIWGTYAQVSYI